MKAHIKGTAALLAATVSALGVSTTGTPALAQTYGGGAYAGVANVSVANGYVTIVRGDSGQQVAASINAPLVPGDYIATGDDSDAEVQFDGISMLRLASDTQARIVNLSPGAREVQLASGTVVLAEEQGADGGAQIDTPSLNLRPDGSGDYRASVLGDGTSLVTVRSGVATISTANGSASLAPGSTLVGRGSSIGYESPVAFDAFDDFNVSRDNVAVASYNANPYVSPQLAGYSNFSRYGRWQNVPGYGEAWAPNDQSQSNFAPYRNGQWVWEPGSGYTWVDNAPTGYATSHYGSWFNNQQYGGWLWQPPASQYQNSSSGLASAWLPAAVAFFLSGTGAGGSGFGNVVGGSGGGLGGLLGGFSGLFGNSGNVDSGSGDIGWIPLAPGERYQPWYGQNGSYPQTSVTNVTNVTNIYNYYGNARYANAVSMVPVSGWRQGRFDRRVAFNGTGARRFAFIRGAVPIVPTTSNLRYASRAVVRRPIALSRTFAAPRLAARAPSTRVSFATQQAKIRAIAVARPRVAAFVPRASTVVRPAYRPIAHPRVVRTAIAPVPARKPQIARLLAPGARPLRLATPIVAPASHAGFAGTKRAPIRSATTAGPQRAIAAPGRRSIAPRLARTPEPRATQPIRTPPPTTRETIPHATPVRIPTRTASPFVAPKPHPTRPVAPSATVAPIRRPVAVPVRTPIAPVARPERLPSHAAPPVARPATLPVRTAEPLAPKAVPVRPVAPVARPVVVPVRPAPTVAHPIAAPAPPVVRHAAPAAAGPVHPAAPRVEPAQKPAPPARTDAPARDAGH